MSKKPETLKAAQARARRLQEKLDARVRLSEHFVAAGTYVGDGKKRTFLLPPAHPITREELCQLRDRLLEGVRQRVKAEPGEKSEFDYYWQLSLVQACNEAISVQAKAGL